MPPISSYTKVMLVRDRQDSKCLYRNKHCPTYYMCVGREQRLNKNRCKQVHQKQYIFLQIMTTTTSDQVDLSAVTIHLNKHVQTIFY